MDRVKIVRALRMCSDNSSKNERRCQDCPYFFKDRVKDRVFCYDLLMKDAADALEDEYRPQNVLAPRASEEGC